MKFSLDEIEKIFTDFIDQYPTVEKPKYLKIVDSLKCSDEVSLYVDFKDLQNFNFDFTEDLLEKADQIFTTLDKVLKAKTGKDKSVFVRVLNLPETVRVKAVRAKELKGFVQIFGIVSTVLSPEPYLKVGVFSCDVCGEYVTIPQASEIYKAPIKCPNPACGRNGPFELVKDYSEFIDSQTIEITDSMEDLKGGEIPRTLQCILFDDLVDTIPAGSRVNITGTMKTRQQVGSNRAKKNMFDQYMVANSIMPTEADIDMIEPTEEEVKQIQELGEKENLLDILVKSTAPSIKGYENIKTAILMQHAGRDRLVLADGTVVRGDSHILLYGDPATGKTKLLKWSASLSPRGIFASADGASRTGLTAMAKKVTDLKWSLEPGVLPLAHKGYASLDEIDKISQEDVSMLHPAMESQIISIHKAGIHTELPAQCPILAGANPKRGRFDPNKPFFDQIDMKSTLISRFDLFFPMRDKQNDANDMEIAMHMLHTISKGDTYLRNNGILDHDFLMKYLLYVKRYVHPKLPDAILETIAKKYVKERKLSQSTGVMSITPRQLEGFSRMALQLARLLQKDVVTEEILEKVFEIYNESIESSARDMETGMLDIDMIETGKPKSQMDKVETILGIITKLNQKYDNKGVLISEVYDEAKEENISRQYTMKVIEELKAKGDVYEPTPGVRIKPT